MKKNRKLQSWVPHDLVFKNCLQFDREAVKFLRDVILEDFTAFLLISLWSSQISRQTYFLFKIFNKWEVNQKSMNFVEGKGSPVGNEDH